MEFRKNDLVTLEIEDCGIDGECRPDPSGCDDAKTQRSVGTDEAA